MKNTFRILSGSVLFFSLLTVQALAAPAIEPSGSTNSSSGENWKGTTHVQPIELGVMTGASLDGSSANWAILATGDYLIKPRGFVTDIDDRVWAELKMGPAFFQTPMDTHSTGFQYQANLRWDFTLNETWTFYGIGGIGGFVRPSDLGSSFTLHPNFGVGAEYQTKTALMLRAEISGDFMGVGVAFNF